MSRLLNSLKEPACQAGGFLVGVTAMKAINKMINSDAVSGFLGETSTDIKKYLTPVITTIGGIWLGNYVSDSTAKAFCNGIAVSGAVDLGMELLYKKNLLSGTGEGVFGSILGDDDDLDGDYDEIEGDPEPETYARPALPSRPAQTQFMPPAVGAIPGVVMEGIPHIGGGIM